MNIFRPARRRHLVLTNLIEADWLWLLEHHPILSGLDTTDLERLKELVVLFLEKKTFEEADGLNMMDAMKAVIAIQACLPILNLGLSWYRNWKTIVVVPKRFTQNRRQVDRSGVVHEWKEQDIGQSWNKGPVVLSWEDVEDSGWADGFNVVIHEAAHRLDLLDGAINGRPELHAGMSPQFWRDVFLAAFQDLEHRIRRGLRTAVDPYALENAGEFFAVVSELFFEQPNFLQREYPDVHDLLVQFYRQDPGQRL
ncbi:MAG: zinc-dependent peptidase [Spirochaetaceae bacterium]|nr:MAG: zinc-dependent peptidase [Spirochaetaceae bacterium]